MCGVRWNGGAKSTDRTYGNINKIIRKCKKTTTPMTLELWKDNGILVDRKQKNENLFSEI